MSPWGDLISCFSWYLGDSFSRRETSLSTSDPQHTLSTCDTSGCGSSNTHLPCAPDSTQGTKNHRPAIAPGQVLSGSMSH